MSKHRVLSLKPQLRLEWRGQDGQNETEQPDHSASLGDSITSSTQIRFSVHTASLRYRIARALLMASQIPTQQKEDSSTAKRFGSGAPCRATAATSLHLTPRKPHAQQRLPETWERLCGTRHHWSRPSDLLFSRRSIAEFPARSASEREPKDSTDRSTQRGFPPSWISHFQGLA